MTSNHWPIWRFLTVLPLLLLIGEPALTQTLVEEATEIVDENAAEAKDASAEEAKIPPGLTTYLGRRIAMTMGYQGAPWLIRKNRQAEEDCASLLKELKLKPGMTICDMGCGNGFYTLQMAKAVGEKGSVLAVDIQSEMLRLLQARAEELQVTNVQPILGTLADPKLPADQIDLILCVDVYHEFSHPVQMLKSMRESLAEGGVIALAEYREEDPTVPIKPLHKMSKVQILKEYETNGFKLVREFEGLPWQHLMFLARDSDKTLKKIKPTPFTAGEKFR